LQNCTKAEHVPSPKAKMPHMPSSPCGAFPFPAIRRYHQTPGSAAQRLPAPCIMLDVESVERIIHCRHCGADNQIKPDVLGKLCDNCGKAIYTPEFEAEIASKPPTPVAIADRTGDVLRVTCPRCRFINEFPEFTIVDIFLCHECGKPVAVKEPVQ